MMKRLFLIVAVSVLFPALAVAQGTGFAFQRRLKNDANSAKGNVKLQFKLFNALSGGVSALTSKENRARQLRVSPDFFSSN